MNCGSYGMFDWQQGQDYCAEDNSSIEISKSMNEADQNVNYVNVFDNQATPIKACGDLAYQVLDNESTGKDIEHYREHSSQVKRRRMLQFESEVLETPICFDEEFLRSKETSEALEDAISEMSQWVAGYTDDISGSSNALDATSEGWIADCLNDTEMHFCTEDFNNASGASDAQVNDVIDLCDSPPEYSPTPTKKHPINAHSNVVLKGKKSFMHVPPKLASSIVYPFAFIKPCGFHGDVTLKDINRRIHNPPKPKEDPVPYPTSAFSGKPVVGKTKIQTEGGKGSITIMRTRG